MREPADNLPWFAVLHRAHLGARARRDLRRLGCAVFWPREVIRERRRDDVLRPLFPGYLFAQPGHRGVELPWQWITDVDDVLAVLGASDDEGMPHPSRIGFVPALLGLANDDGVIRLAAYEALVGIKREAPPVLEAGQSVRMVDGTWDGFPGTVQEVLTAADGATRVRLLVEIFGRSTPVETALESVEAT